MKKSIIVLSLLVICLFTNSRLSAMDADLYEYCKQDKKDLTEQYRLKEVQSRIFKQYKLKNLQNTLFNQRRLETTLNVNTKMDHEEKKKLMDLLKTWNKADKGWHEIQKRRKKNRIESQELTIKILNKKTKKWWQKLVK